MKRYSLKSGLIKPSRGPLKRNLLAAALASLLLAPVAYIAVRSYVLLTHTSELIAISDRFSRDYYVGDKTQKPLLYLALGDSTAAGVGVSRVEETYPYLVAQSLASSRRRYVHVLNAAESGARIADVQTFQLQAVIDRKPDVVTMSIGANDATHNTDESFFQSCYDSVLRGIDTPEILVAATPDMAYAPAIQPIYGNIAGDRAQTQNRWLTTHAANYKIKIVDIYTQGKLDYKTDPSIYASDRFHPSSKGYAVWAKLFVKQLR